MDIYQQIRTQQGRLPARRAELRTEPEKYIEFALCSPTDESLAEKRKDPELTLENLGLCRGLPQAKEIAEACGPLFGVGERESVAAWGQAITVASAAVMLQDALNGQRINEFVTDNLGLVKERYTNAETGASCLVYTLSFCVRQGSAREYLDWIGRCPLPWSRRFPDAERIDYAVCYLGDDPEDDLRSCITMHLFSFEAEIGVRDFTALLETAVQDDRAVAALEAQLDESQFVATDGESLLRFADEATPIAADNEPCTLADAPQLQHIVQVLASLHMEGIRMDVFSAQASEGFMVFPSYLSYLWFNFAQSLASVKVALCPICGRGFSKAGHRGPDKIYCSDTCKAAARNRKDAAKRDEVRRLFLQEGLSVEEIRHAKMDGAPIGWGKARIVKTLKGWVELRHARPENPDLVLRCLSEGIINKREAGATLKRYVATHPDEGPRVREMLRNM